MKKFYTLLFVAFSGYVCSQTITFADPAFKSRLLQASPSQFIAFNSSSVPVTVDTNSDGEIQVSEAQAISFLQLSHPGGSVPKITSLSGIENFTNLISLSAEDNLITSFSANTLVNLTNLNLPDNQLTTIDVSGLSSLQYLFLTNNLLTTLDCAGLSQLKTVHCWHNALTSVDLDGLINLNELLLSENQIASIDLSMLSSITNLVLDDNQLTSLDVSMLTTLTHLQCGENQLSVLDVSNLINLEGLGCEMNQLATLDVSNCNLKNLSCWGNNLTTLNLANQVNMENFICSQNQLTTLDVTGFYKMTNFDCDQNLLTDIMLGGNTALEYFGAANNQLTTMDFSDCYNIASIALQNNNLGSLFIKNGKMQGYWEMNFGGNPNLSYICADPSEFATVQQWIGELGIDCHVNTYCTFTPGGVYTFIGGTQNYDAENDGCDDNEQVMPNLTYSVTTDGTSGTVIPEANGAFLIPIAAQTASITPVLENPSYFTVTPPSVIIESPAPLTVANFCIAPNGVHNDLQVILVPIDPARPGFDIRYKAIARNRGTQAQSAVVSLVFPDLTVDFVDASPTITTQTENNISWTIADIQPFQQLEFFATFNCNSPMETPPVNGGDVLNYAASITSEATDETPGNNIFGLKHGVVNSFDPNDKTCLEGETVGPEMIGGYVHYMIRFENTGTFAAQNIVVKDMIDLSKFDLSTLVPVDGSHLFETRISDVNRVEFIFENINLPFDDANNDGYLVFKIRTKTTLTIGDTFSNSAEIYFDYNFPIVTNIATTTIQLLDASDFDFAKQFTIYPNPAKDQLNILTSQGLNPRSACIYNSLGQPILKTVGWNESLDISSLATGSYFIRIDTDKGNVVGKFVKI